MRSLLVVKHESRAIGLLPQLLGIGGICREGRVRAAALHGSRRRSWQSLQNLFTPPVHTAKQQFTWEHSRGELAAILEDLVRQKARNSAQVIAQEP